MIYVLATSTNMCENNKRSKYASINTKYIKYSFTQNMHALIFSLLRAFMISVLATNTKVHLTKYIKLFKHKFSHVRVDILSQVTW